MSLKGKIRIKIRTFMRNDNKKNMIIGKNGVICVIETKI